MAGRLLGISIILALGLGRVPQSSASSDPALVGLWLTEDGDARVRIERCGEGLCGRIVWMSDPVDETGAARRDVENPDPDLRGRPVQGMTILRIGDTPNAEGVHHGGRIYDPKSGRTYRCNLSREGEDLLKMRGYLGISLIGRTTHWRRLADDGRASSPPTLADGR